MKKVFLNLILALPILIVLALVIVPLIFFAAQKNDEKASRCNPATQIESDSIQNKEEIFDRIFKNGCFPQELILEVPSNQKVSNNRLPAMSSAQQNGPQISTFITVSDKSKKLSIIRIDQTNGRWLYAGQSCLAHKWTTKDQKQVLTLSMIRNLQIYSPKIQKIIFIVALPFELLERKSEISIQPYTWSIVGGMNKFNSKKFTQLSEELRLAEYSDNPKANKAFLEGEEVPQSLIPDLDEIGAVGAIYYSIKLEEEESRLNKKDASRYSAVSESSNSCAPPVRLEKN